jgi:tetratricopeptide (TPR) repeat protein
MLTRVLVAVLMAASAACGSKGDDSGAAAAPAAGPTDAAVGDAAAARSEPTPAEVTRVHESYAAALARGRQLIGAGKATEAAAAFRAALDARPGDPEALSELSWALFSLGDHPAAIDAATRSIAAAGHDPSLAAASLYNRGRAREAGGDRDGAVADYQESYRLRPHRVVRARLESVGATVPESVWTARALEGPFADIDEYCAAVGGCQEPWPVAGIDPAVIPWASQVQRVQLRDDFDEGPRISLLFETEDGWFALRGFEIHLNRYDWSVLGTTVVGGRLAIEHRNSKGRFAHEDRRLLTVCGVGASGRPSCFGPTGLSHSFTGYEGGKDDGRYLPQVVYFRCAGRLGAGDRVTITAGDAGCRKRVGFTGEHRLVFP